LNYAGVKANMAKTFREMVERARSKSQSIAPDATRQLLATEPGALVVDVRDLADIATTGVIPGTATISLGTLAKKACLERPPDKRDTRLDDRSRPIVTTCEVGLMAILAAQTLQEMGFTRVAYVDGGTQAWIDAGYPVVPLATTPGED
jgi:rhodanese-related sulfurtransferase